MIGVARSRNNKLVSTCTLDTSVVVFTRARSPGDCTVESNVESIVVGGDARQVAIHILCEDGNGRVVCVVGVFTNVVWGVPCAQGDLLVGIRVDDVPNARTAQQKVSVFQACQIFVVVGILQSASC